jgi:hypothetical protein
MRTLRAARMMRSCSTETRRSAVSADIAAPVSQRLIAT